ncbi:MAG: transcription/translation regulatory transformer protein RfaH [Candidatus Binataceae bacterium]|nr:transcription/translation regulatory transformer protein RfaH [Candidatus Binataceae bacterium]
MAMVTQDDSSQWYLVRTKAGRERWVRDQLSGTMPEVFLPMLRMRMSRWGKLGWSTAPLFPCYVFVRCDLAIGYYEIKYGVGVTDLVSAGNEPLIVAPEIVTTIRARATDGVVEIVEQPFAAGERVVIAEGPFRGFEAIFERYLSGEERVAILLNSAIGSSLRMVLPSAVVARERPRGRSQHNSQHKG